MKKQLDIILRVLGVVFLLLITITLFNQCQAQKYRVTWGKVATWAGFGVSGSVWGAREAYHADLKVFEKKWGVSPYSFFGSKAWERQYKTNRYYTPDGQVNPHKPEFFNTIRDFWHSSGVLSRSGTVCVTFIIGGSKQPLKHRLLDMAIGSAVGVVSASVTYGALR